MDRDGRLTDRVLFMEAHQPDAPNAFSSKLTPQRAQVMRETLDGVSGEPVSLRPVTPGDLSSIEHWARFAADHMSRTRPCAAGADRHAPQAGLYWYVIVDDGRDLGTVWIELPPAAAEAVLGVFLGGPAALGHGIGTAAVELAVSEFRAAHPHLPVVLRVRRSNARAIACYRRAGFALTGSGTKSLPSGERVPYHRMVLPPS